MTVLQAGIKYLSDPNVVVPSPRAVERLVLKTARAFIKAHNPHAVPVHEVTIDLVKVDGKLCVWFDYWTDVAKIAGLCYTLVRKPQLRLAITRRLIIEKTKAHKT